MTEPDGCWIGLPYLEASQILARADNGGIPKTPAAASVAEKVRRALLLTGFDARVEIHIHCTPEEQKILERLRDPRGGFSISS